MAVQSAALMWYMLMSVMRISLYKESLKTLRESIRHNDVDSFHRHLDELEKIVQNNDQMKVLLQQDGTLCLAAHVGSNPVVETLIEKGVGKKYICLPCIE